MRRRYSEPTISQTELGHALLTLSHLVWPLYPFDMSKPWKECITDDKRPLFALAVERGFGEEGLKEVRKVQARLRMLYDQNKDSYSISDIAPYAETLIGIDRFLGERTGNFEIPSVRESEKPLPLSQALVVSYAPFQKNKSDLISFNKLIQLAEKSVDAASHSSPGQLAKYGKEHAFKSVHQI